VKVDAQVGIAAAAMMTTSGAFVGLPLPSFATTNICSSANSQLAGFHSPHHSSKSAATDTTLTIHSSQTPAIYYTHAYNTTTPIIKEHHVRLKGNCRAAQEGQTEQPTSDQPREVRCVRQ